MEKPSAVLFACSANAVRSAMAEGLLRFLSSNQIYTDSCGVKPADEVNPFAVAVMDEIGIDISGHTPTSFTELDDTSFDLVVSLTPEAQHSAVDLTRTIAADVMYWPCHDPTLVTGSREQILQAFRDVRDDLRKKIEELIDWQRPPTV